MSDYFDGMNRLADSATSGATTTSPAQATRIGGQDSWIDAYGQSNQGKSWGNYFDAYRNAFKGSDPQGYDGGGYGQVAGAGARSQNTQQQFLLNALSRQQQQQQQAPQNDAFADFMKMYVQDNAQRQNDLMDFLKLTIGHANQPAQSGLTRDEILALIEGRLATDLPSPDAGTPGAGTPGAGTPGAGTPGAAAPGAKIPSVDGRVPRVGAGTETGEQRYNRLADVNLSHWYHSDPDNAAYFHWLHPDKEAPQASSRDPLGAFEKNYYQREKENQFADWYKDATAEDKQWLWQSHGIDTRMTDLFKKHGATPDQEKLAHWMDQVVGGGVSWKAVEDQVYAQAQREEQAREAARQEAVRAEQERQRALAAQNAQRYFAQPRPTLPSGSVTQVSQNPPSSSGMTQVSQNPFSSSSSAAAQNAQRYFAQPRPTLPSGSVTQVSRNPPSSSGSAAPSRPAGFDRDVGHFAPEFRPAGFDRDVGHFRR